MNKPAKKSLVPKLRFPEFREEGEWKIQPLDKLLTISNGRDYKHLYDGNIPVYGSGGYMLSVNDWLHDGESVCIGRKGTIDRPMFITGKFWTVDTLFYTHSFIDCLPKFIYAIFQQINWANHNEAGGVPSLSKTNIGKIKVAVPKSKEQQKIADCLSSLDDLISAQAQKIDALKTHKKGLMQQLFPAEGETAPKQRFPEFSWDWIPYKIGDFIESYCGGAALTPSDFSLTPDYEVIPKKAITEGGWLRIDSQNPTYCNEVFYKNNLQSVVDSTYLITTLRDLVPSGPSIGYIVKYKKNKKYLLAQGVYGFKTKQDIFSDFLIHFSNSNVYRKMMQSVMVGSTQVHIRTSIFFDIPIFIPTLKEQQKVADCLSSLDDLITAHTQKLDALKNLKKGLMQQLFPAIDEVSA